MSRVDPHEQNVSQTSCKLLNRSHISRIELDVFWTLSVHGDIWHQLKVSGAAIIVQGNWSDPRSCKRHEFWIIEGCYVLVFSHRDIYVRSQNKEKLLASTGWAFRRQNNLANLLSVIPGVSKSSSNSASFLSQGSIHEHRKVKVVRNKWFALWSEVKKYEDQPDKWSLSCTTYSCQEKTCWRGIELAYMYVWLYKWPWPWQEQSCFALEIVSDRLRCNKASLPPGTWWQHAGWDSKPSHIL